MNRILSTKSVLKCLRESGFDMNSIIKIKRGHLEVGYLTDGIATWKQRDKNIELAEQASALIGWTWCLNPCGAGHLQVVKN